MIFNTLLAVASTLTHKEIIQEILVYNVFFMMGYILYRHISKKRIYVFLISSLLLTVLLLAYEHFTKGEISTMQSHKFPPDIIFLAYGTFALCLISAIISHDRFSEIRLPRFAVALIDLWNKRGYTIYLYQNFAYFAFVHLVPYELYHTNCFLANFAIAAVSIFALSTALSCITCPFEKCSMDVLKQMLARSIR